MGKMIFFVTSAIWASVPVFGNPTLSTLAAFSGSNGANPWGGLLSDVQGNLYGATYYGGPDNDGSVFELANGSHDPMPLAFFNGQNGRHPEAGLIADANGNLYGTTTYGGDGDYGTVFRLDAVSRSLSTLVRFNGANGGNPSGNLLGDAKGNVYGTTFYQGGTIFKVAGDTHMLSTLATFSSGSGGGVAPIAGLIADAAGNLFGTTEFGGPKNGGTVFEIAAGSHLLSTLAFFSGPDGAFPNGSLVADARGKLYGTTSMYGPGGGGTVFKIAAGTHELSTLATLTEPNQATPFGGLILDAAGNLYGTTFNGGGSNNLGTVFKVDGDTGSVLTLATFNGVNGSHPHSELIADADGNLYGTTYDGGPDNDGVIFKLANTGFVVPEPASLALQASVSLLLFTRRRHRY